MFSLLKERRKLLVFIKLGFISITCIRKCPLLTNVQAYITGDLLSHSLADYSIMMQIKEFVMGYFANQRDRF